MAVKYKAKIRNSAEIINNFTMVHSVFFFSAFTAVVYNLSWHFEDLTLAHVTHSDKVLVMQKYTLQMVLF